MWVTNGESQRHHKKTTASRLSQHNTPQHNTQKYILPKKNIDTMIPPRSLASSGSNLLGEWSRRTSRDSAPSALRGDAIFLCATN